MKKIVIFIAVAILSVISVSGQDLNWDSSGGHRQQRFSHSVRGFYFGPIAGINVSTISQQSYVNSRVRPIVGLMIGYQISNIIGLQAEALYSWQGANHSTNGSKTSLNYFKIPLLLKLNIIGGLQVEAGISFEPLIYSSQTYSDGNVTVKIPYVNKFETSIPVGLSYLFFRRLELSARYYIPLVKLYDIEGMNSFNSVFSFTLKYRI